MHDRQVYLTFCKNRALSSFKAHRAGRQIKVSENKTDSHTKLQVYILGTSFKNNIDWASPPKQKRERTTPPTKYVPQYRIKITAPPSSKNHITHLIPH